MKSYLTINQLKARIQQLENLIKKFPTVRSLVRRWGFELVVLEGKLEVLEARKPEAPKQLTIWDVKPMTEYTEYTDVKAFREALEMLRFSVIAGEEIISFAETTIPSKSPFLPSISGWEITTKSGRIVTCTQTEKMQTELPCPCPIKYVGKKHDQFESRQGFYQ